ncbi:MAG TPA: hypothetical protein VI854_01460 [Acidimicrobiia bacterium]|nr:hypothetical protein [Acidimicrobiia bacterium]
MSDRRPTPCPARRPGPRRLAAAAALTALALAGAGACGSEEDSPALSPEEFRKQGNAICAAGDTELEKAGEKLFGTDGKTVPTPEVLAEFFTGNAIPIARRKLDQLEALEPPKKDRELVEEMIASGRDATDEVEEGLEDDPKGFLSEKGPDPFDDFDEMATELGLDECVGRES